MWKFSAKIQYIYIKLLTSGTIQNNWYDTKFWSKFKYQTNMFLDLEEGKVGYYSPLFLTLCSIWSRLLHIKINRQFFDH